MEEKVKNAMQTFNNISVSLKNIFWIFGIIFAVVFFYFQVDNHIKNQEIHISNEKIKNLTKEIQGLRDRIEFLEWDFQQQKMLNERRHKKQGVIIDEIKSKL